MRVIGIDNWAWRCGRRYGTLICDLERRRIVDLLPDREPATVEAWLDRHPGIEIVARDRNGGYARAVSRALPNAVQVADRWHLLDNCGKAFLAAVRRSMPDIRKAFDSRAIDPGLLTGAERLLYEGFLRRQQTNSTVRRMAGDGLPIKQIVLMTGLNRNLVRQIRRGEREDAFRLRQSSLEPWLPWLTREWEGGCRNGAELWRRLRAKGSGKPARRRRMGDTTAARGSVCLLRAGIPPAWPVPNPRPVGRRGRQKRSSAGSRFSVSWHISNYYLLRRLVESVVDAKAADRIACISAFLDVPVRL